MAIKHVVLGTGAIGRAVMEELVRRGESVRMVNRSGQMAEAPAEVEVLASDLYDPAKVKEVMQGAKVVYQASQPRYNEWVEEFPLLQKSILDGLAGSEAKLVIVENLYMYGDTNGKILTENSPYTVHTRKGRVRAEISRAAFNAHEEGRVKVTSARGGNLFGPWGTDSTMGARVLSDLARKAGPVDRPHGSTSFPYLREGFWQGTYHSR